MPLLFLMFLTVPALELFLLIQIGSFIGAGNTVAIVFVTALLGATLLRREGLHTLLHAQQRLAAGEAPARELVEGGMLVFAGALLLTPGFMTDLVGLSCLLPPLRRRVADALLKRMLVQFGETYVQAQFDSTLRPDVRADEAYRQSRPSHDRGSADRSGDIIEGEYERKE